MYSQNRVEALATDVLFTNDSLRAALADGREIKLAWNGFIVFETLMTMKEKIGVLSAAG